MSGTLDPAVLAWLRAMQSQQVPTSTQNGMMSQYIGSPNPPMAAGAPSPMPIPLAQSGTPAYPIPSPPADAAQRMLEMPHDYYRTQQQLGTSGNATQMDRNLNMLLQLLYARQAGRT